MVVLLFILAFGVGPALFWLLLRRDVAVWPTGITAAILVALSFALRKEASLPAAFEPSPAVLSVFLIWLAWILILVFLVAAIRRSFPDETIRARARILGAMGTTLPWFGYAAANMMAD